MENIDKKYTINDESGRIVELEKANEELRKQKQSLKSTLKILFAAITISNISNFIEVVPDIVTNVNTVYEDTKNDVKENETQALVNSGLTLEEATAIETLLETNEQDLRTTGDANRDKLLQDLIDSGLTEEEAQKTILAAEEKAANEQGLHTEAEYNEMISAIDKGISTEEQRELANQQLINYNDYENYYNTSNSNIDEDINSTGKVR